ncbi:MAG TPA: penicillin-binding protein 2, partial [Acidimicrobiales bacterium]
RTGNITLTIRSDLQALAQKELAGRDGSVVMLDPKTGAVLALYSYPDFDPNLLSHHPQLKGDPSAAAKALLEADTNQPLLARAYRQIFFPGSTFKLVTGSVGVQTGAVTETTPSYPVSTSYKPPRSGNYHLGNDAGESCGGTLFRILASSCNSAFGQMGVELGPDKLAAGADAFGFNSRPPIDLPAPVASYFPPPLTFVNRSSSLAQSAIGQFDVKATPLQMALVAAGIANGGKIEAPHVLNEIRDGDGDLIKDDKPQTWKTPISPATADLMKQAMVSVVTSGTGRGLGIPGMEVGLKTGTAQLGTNPPTSHTWIVGWAGPPGDPQVAIAVIIERQPGDHEATGARVAGPVAKDLLTAALNPPAKPGGSGG